MALPLQCASHSIRLPPTAMSAQEPPARCPRTSGAGGESADACSERARKTQQVLSGPRLAKVLGPAVELQTRALECLSRGEACEPLSIHTSAGVPAALGGFLEALAVHLPWAASGEDWFVNLQLEGATAVWAAVEVLMRRQQQNNAKRTHVAVGDERPAVVPGADACGRRGRSLPEALRRLLGRARRAHRRHPLCAAVGLHLCRPPMDIEKAELREGLMRLARCLERVREQAAAS